MQQFILICVVCRLRCSDVAVHVFVFVFVSLNIKSFCQVVCYEYFSKRQTKHRFSLMNFKLSLKLIEPGVQPLHRTDTASLKLCILCMYVCMF